jgi:hypothetical protein
MEGERVFVVFDLRPPARLSSELQPMIPEVVFVFDAASQELLFAHCIETDEIGME